MASGESTPDLKFLAYGHGPQSTYNFEAYDTAGCTTFYGNKIHDITEINTCARTHDLGQLAAGILHSPTVEAIGFAIVAVKHL